MAGLLVEEAELGLFQARLRVVGLLLAFRLAANPRHGWLSWPCRRAGSRVGEVFFSIPGLFCLSAGRYAAEEERRGIEDLKVGCLSPG